MYGVIYVIINLLNGMRYVGQTRQPLKKRMYQHKHRDLFIDRAIRHYGWDNFTVEVLEECDTLEQLNERERFWIAYFNCKYPNGYNLTDGGDGTAGFSPSVESREKNAATQRKRFEDPAEHTKLSIAHMGKKLSTEHRAKISVAESGENHYNFGKHRAPETCVKLSVANRGNTPFKNLLKAITDRQLTYGALAKLLGLSKTTVSNKMHGSYNFTAKDIAKLVEIFGLSAEHLMARDD